MITISTRLLKEAEHRIDVGEIDGCSCCIYRDDCMGVYSIGGEPQFPFCADAVIDEYFDLEAYKEIIKEEWNDMSLLEKICKELGVEVGEEWKNDVGDTYKITDKGLYYKWTPTGWDECDRHDYNRLLTGKLKPVWKPKVGDRYYYPFLIADESERYVFNCWGDTDGDKWYRDNDLMFKTKEEAIKCANKMLEVIK